MFTIDGEVPFYFDIETEDLAAIDNNFVSAAGLSNTYQNTVLTVNKLQEMVEWARMDGIIVTYHGENYHGGFDFAFLRTFFLQHDLEWPFKNIKHLDLAPLIEKRLNTKINERSLPSKSNLYSSNLKEICKANGVEYQGNKDDTYEMLKTMDENQNGINWLGRDDIEAVEYNDLQSVYQFFFDPNKEERYIDGGKVPELYAKIIELKRKINKHNRFSIQMMINNLYKEIMFHNRQDVRRLKEVTEKVIPIMPDWEVERAINRL